MITDFSGGGVTLETSPAEYGFFQRVMNDSLNVPPEVELPRRIGETRERGGWFLDRLQGLERDARRSSIHWYPPADGLRANRESPVAWNTSVEFSPTGAAWFLGPEEYDFLFRCLTDRLAEIGDWEVSARLGLSDVEARKLRSHLVATEAAAREAGRHWDS